MRSQVQKWGNSLALRIPSAFAAELGLSLDAPIELTLEDGKLVITPASERRYRLRDLLKGISSDNLHSEQDHGPAVGAEVW